MTDYVKTTVWNEAYLEVIAINPEANPPRHPRWFALDSARLREQLESGPRLVTWVINTTDIQSLAEQADFDIGLPTRLSRDALEWEFALPADGRLLGDGLLPYCIQWHSSPHPSEHMLDNECLLQELTLFHNRPRWLGERLDSIAAGHLVEIEKIADNESPSLVARIDTPKGTVELR